MCRIDRGSFDHAFALVMNTDQDAGPPRTSRLNGLLYDLCRDDPARDPAETMELIWAIWIDHKDKQAADRMAGALEAIAAGDTEVARPALDALVITYPGWAEAWNKRALIAFLEKRDDDSISDIARTLELEPRHFGAMLGFGQICLRNGYTLEAKAAFGAALRLNPHVHGLREMIADIAATTRPLH
jgi:tetratricopeptide (TPR) repeat protein